MKNQSEERRVYMRVWTVEQGYVVSIHWQVTNHQRFIKERSGRTCDLLRGNIRVTAYQDSFQHHVEPISERELRCAARAQLEGKVKTYKLALG